MPTFTTIVKYTPEFNIPAYSIHTVVNSVITSMLAGSARGSKCKTSYHLAYKDTGQHLVATIILQNMRQSEIDRALVISEMPEVPEKVGHANQPANSHIICINCHGDLFYTLDRDRFYNRHACANCLAPAQTLTETGAST